MSQFVHTLANAGPFKEKKETYFTKNGKLCKESVAKKYSTDCNWLLAIYIYSSNSFIGLSFTQGRRNRVGRGAIAAPDFGWSINPIPTREADYAHHITNAPPQDFQTFLLPYTLSMF